MSMWLSPQALGPPFAESLPSRCSHWRRQCGGVWLSGLLSLEVGGFEKKVVLFPHEQMKPSHGPACVAWNMQSHMSRSRDTSPQIEGPLAPQVVRLILHKRKMEVSEKASRALSWTDRPAEGSHLSKWPGR